MIEHRGSTLADPMGLLEGTGKLGRHVKLRPGIPLDSRALEAAITEAYRNIKACLRIGGARGGID